MENQTKEMRKPPAEALPALLQNFSTLTGLSVSLFQGKSSLVLACPEEEADFWEAASYSERADLLSLMRRCEETGGAVCGRLGTAEEEWFDAAVCPVIREGIALGFLVLKKDGEERWEASCAMLPVLAEYLAVHGMTDCRWNTYISRFRQFVYDHADQDLGIETMAAAMHVGKTTLYEQFHTYAGMPYAKYIKRIRLEKACDLLAGTDLPVTEISAKVGFADYNYFCRTFRKEIGVSAGAYRKARIAERGE